MGSFLALITVIDPVGGGAPGTPSHPIHIPGFPSQGLPPFPSHPIAPGGPPSHPIAPGSPGGGGQPGGPSQLPGHGRWVWSPVYGWVFDPGFMGGNPDHRPDNSLPGNQPGIDNSLPGRQPRPDNSLPGDQPGIDNSLPGSQPQPDNELPEHAQPK